MTEMKYYREKRGTALLQRIGAYVCGCHAAHLLCKRPENENQGDDGSVGRHGSLI